MHWFEVKNDCKLQKFKLVEAILIINFTDTFGRRWCFQEIVSWKACSSWLPYCVGYVILIQGCCSNSWIRTTLLDKRFLWGVQAGVPYPHSSHSWWCVPWRTPADLLPLKQWLLMVVELLSPCSKKTCCTTSLGAGDCFAEFMLRMLKDLLGKNVFDVASSAFLVRVKRCTSTAVHGVCALATQSLLTNLTVLSLCWITAVFVSPWWEDRSVRLQPRTYTGARSHLDA